MGSFFFDKKSDLLGEDEQEVLGLLADINIYIGIALIASICYLTSLDAMCFSFVALSFISFLNNYSYFLL